MNKKIDTSGAIPPKQMDGEEETNPRLGFGTATPKQNHGEAPGGQLIINTANPAAFEAVKKAFDDTANEYFTVASYNQPLPDYPGPDAAIEAWLYYYDKRKKLHSAFNLKDLLRKINEVSNRYQSKPLKYDYLLKLHSPSYQRKHKKKVQK